MRILFVCTGNTCRSPIAEALFRQKAKGMEVEVRSAGVVAFAGDSASPQTQRVLKEYGIHHYHEAKRLDRQLIDWADLVLTMTGGQKKAIADAFSAAADKVYTLKKYVGYHDRAEIADPYGGDLTTYRQCAGEIEQKLDLLLEKLADFRRLG